MDGLSFLEFTIQFPIPSGAAVNSFLDLQLKWIRLCFFFTAVFWGDIALDEEDLKLFHVDKAHDWIRQSGEEVGHGTGKSCAPSSPALEGRVRDSSRGRCGPQVIGIGSVVPCPSPVELRRGHSSFSISGCRAGASRFAYASKKIFVCLFILRFNL